MEENTNFGLIAYDNEEDLERKLYDMLQINKNQQDQIYNLSESVEASVNQIAQDIEEADVYYFENKDGCTLLSPFSYYNKTFPYVYFYARHFGRLKGSFTVTFMGICSGKTVSSTVTLYVDGEAKITRTLSASNYATVDTTFDLDLPLCKGLHEIKITSTTVGSSTADNLAVYSYSYNLPHPYIECLSSAMNYYVGLGNNMEMLAKSDGHTAKYKYRFVNATSAYADDLITELTSTTYTGFGDVINVDVYNHQATGMKNVPVIVARTPNTSRYYMLTDFAGASTKSMEVEHKYFAVGCIATLSSSTDGSPQTLYTFVYQTTDGVVKMKTADYNGTVTTIDLPSIKDNIFRIIGTRGISGADVPTVDFLVETVEGKLIHYNFEGESPAVAPTKIHRKELGYGREPVLYFNEESNRYILLYRKKGSLYRKEFTLDKTKSAYKIYAEKYLCDGEKIYLIDNAENYAIVYNNKFVKTTIDNPKGY